MRSRKELEKMSKDELISNLMKQEHTIEVMKHRLAYEKTSFVGIHRDYLHCQIEDGDSFTYGEAAYDILEDVFRILESEIGEIDDLT